MSDPTIYAQLAAMEKRLKALERQESGGLSGTWTPVVTGSLTPGTLTYTTIARYVRLGPMAFCGFTVVFSAIAVAATGDLQITGMPFTARNLTGYQQSGVLSQWNNLDYTAGYTPGFNIINNSTTLEFVQSNDNVASLVIPAGALTATTFFRGAIAYEVA
jgi:hypothetical protein